MFPIAQTACYAISKFGDDNNFTNKGIPPLSIIDWHWSEDPDAILVSAQVASS